MKDAPLTRPTLLIRIRDVKDQRAWEQFVSLYAPLVYGFARKRGLQDADAADLAQEVLRSVARVSGKFDYDLQRGSFRSWLFTIVRNKLNNFLTRQKAYDKGTGGTTAQSLLQQVSAREEGADSWDQEYDRRLFAWAAEQVRPTIQETTWEAFRFTAVEGLSGQEVADRLGITVAAVYLAKSRVTTRLKELIREVHGE